MRTPHTHHKTPTYRLTARVRLKICTKRAGISGNPCLPPVYQLVVNKGEGAILENPSDFEQIPQKSSAALISDRSGGGGRREGTDLRFCTHFPFLCVCVWGGWILHEYPLEDGTQICFTVPLINQILKSSVELLIRPLVSYRLQNRGGFLLNVPPKIHWSLRVFLFGGEGIDSTVRIRGDPDNKTLSFRNLLVLGNQNTPVSARS